jgi:CRISPR-associated protein Cmr3
MKAILIEPTDTLFVRDAIPMSAGQGRGAGCRLPFPSTLHESLRSSLLRARNESGLKKTIPGRPRAALRSGNWHASSDETDILIASKAFRTLRTVGPLPWHPKHGLLLPVPLDTVFGASKRQLARLVLWRNSNVSPDQALERGKNFQPLCLPVATTPPDKHAQMEGWWTAQQYQAYLRGEGLNSGPTFEPVPTSNLWQPEHRVGVQIDPGTSSATRGQLYAGSFLRTNPEVRIAAWAQIADPSQAHGTEAQTRQSERDELDRLGWLLLGGEFRLARLWRSSPGLPALEDVLTQLRKAPLPDAEGPCLLKWVLITPAIFAHGSLPGWCADTAKDRAGTPRPMGRVCLDLPGRAQLVSWCIGKPRTVSGWDLADSRAKPTLLAVPEGGTYHFLCENRTTAIELARKLHWQPRSDFYGEKGCGYGLVSFDVQTHPASADIRTLAKEIFNR